MANRAQQAAIAISEKQKAKGAAFSTSQAPGPVKNGPMLKPMKPMSPNKFQTLKQKNPFQLGSLMKRSTMGSAAMDGDEIMKGHRRLETCKMGKRGNK